MSKAFSELIASGWDIEYTTGKGARCPLPDEAGEVESVVLLFDSEPGLGTLWTPAEFAQFAPGRLTRKLHEAAIRDVESTRGDC